MTTATAPAIPATTTYYKLPETPPPGWVEYTWVDGSGRFRYRNGDVVEIPRPFCYVEHSDNAAILAIANERDL